MNDNSDDDDDDDGDGDVHLLWTVTVDEVYC